MNLEISTFYLQPTLSCNKSMCSFFIKVFSTVEDFFKKLFTLIVAQYITGNIIKFEKNDHQDLIICIFLTGTMIFLLFDNASK